MRTILLFLTAATLASAAPPADAEKTAKAFVEKAKATHGELTTLKSDALAGVFPDLAFYSVRFRQWPVAQAPAENFRSSNVLVVGDKAEPALVTSGMQWSKLFTNVVAKDEKVGQNVVRALLTLESELMQDGFYKFKFAEESLVKRAGDILSISTKMEVTEGGNGDITATVTFDATGKVSGTALNSTVKQGMRPRCQATLLLHADPEVRAVCERGLMILGLSAREYLREQREKASPALQAEIDRVWRKIEAAGR